MKFRTAASSVRCSPRVVAVLQASWINCFDAAPGDRIYNYYLSYSFQVSWFWRHLGYGLVAVDSRWLAFSGNPVAVSNGGHVSPQHLSLSTGMISSPSNGSLVAHYVKESNRWPTEFNQQRENVDPEAWAHSFEQLQGANGWASELEWEQSQMASIGQIRNGNMSNIAAMEHSPTGSISADWADEYQAQYNVGPTSWADQFVHEELSQGMDKCANEFAKEHQQHEGYDQWVNEFSKLHVQDWAEEFGHQVSEGLFGKSSADNWVDAYDKYLYEQLLVSKQRFITPRGVYVFSIMNPYVGHPNTLKEGQELFCKGLLNEAIPIIEAKVLKNANNAEGWRFPGIKHAENDDDQQAIASMIASAMFTTAKKHVYWGQPIMLSGPKLYFLYPSTPFDPGNGFINHLIALDPDFVLIKL